MTARTGEKVAAAVRTAPDAASAAGWGHGDGVGRRGRGQVRDVFRLRVLGAEDGNDLVGGGLASFRERIVA